MVSTCLSNCGSMECTNPSEPFSSLVSVYTAKKTCYSYCRQIKHTLCVLKEHKRKRKKEGKSIITWYSVIRNSGLYFLIIIVQIFNKKYSIYKVLTLFLTNLEILLIDFGLNVVVWCLYPV